MIEVRGPITRADAERMTKELAGEAVAITDQEGAVIAIVPGATLLDIYDMPSNGRA